MPKTANLAGPPTPPASLCTTSCPAGGVVNQTPPRGGPRGGWDPSYGTMLLTTVGHDITTRAILWIRGNGKPHAGPSYMRLKASKVKMEMPRLRKYSRYSPFPSAEVCSQPRSLTTHLLRSSWLHLHLLVYIGTTSAPNDAQASRSA